MTTKKKAKKCTNDYEDINFLVGSNYDNIENEENLSYNDALFNKKYYESKKSKKKSKKCNCRKCLGRYKPVKKKCDCDHENLRCDVCDKNIYYKYCNKHKKKKTKCDFSDLKPIPIIYINNNDNAINSQINVDPEATFINNVQITEFDYQFNFEKITYQLNGVNNLVIIDLAIYNVLIEVVTSITDVYVNFVLSNRVNLDNSIIFRNFIDSEIDQSLLPAFTSFNGVTPEIITTDLFMFDETNNIIFTMTNGVNNENNKKFVSMLTPQRVIFITTGENINSFKIKISDQEKITFYYNIIYLNLYHSNNILGLYEVSDGVIAETPILAMTSI